MQKSTSTEAAKDLTNVIKINEDQFKNHLGEMVRSTVEETLNDMLDTEADQLCNAQRYERTEARTGGRAGHYKRKLHTTSGEVQLHSCRPYLGGSSMAMFRILSIRSDRPQGPCIVIIGSR